MILRRLLKSLIELNPRQLKRFINGLLLLISGNKYGPQQTQQFLVLQVLQKKWVEVYQNLVDPQRRNRLIKYLDSPRETRVSLANEIREKQKNGKPLDEFETTLGNMALDPNLTTFIDNYRDVIVKTDPNEYEQAKGIVDSKLFSSSNEGALECYEQLYTLLIDTNKNFRDQVQLRDQLANLLEKRQPEDKTLPFEDMFEKNYNNMNEEENNLFNQIRQRTELMKSYNSRMLRLLTGMCRFDDLVEIKVLKEHLEVWIKKFDEKFKDPNVGLIYVGVKEKKPFPTGIERIIEKKINSLKIPKM